MPAKSRTPGTTNAPGGKWASARNVDRIRKGYRFTLSDEESALADALAPRYGGRAAAVGAALRLLAERDGVVPPGGRPGRASDPPEESS